MSARSPSFAELFAAFERQFGQRLRVGMPGEIVAWDATAKVAEVQPLLKDLYRDIEGKLIGQTLPVIVNVPVLTCTSGDWGMTVPINPGDECWLMFSDASLDGWWYTGGVNMPFDTPRHQLTDAVALVGLHSRTKAFTEYDPNSVQIGKLGGVRVRVEENVVHLGVQASAPGTQDTIRGTEYRQAEDAFFEALDKAVSVASLQLTSAGATLTSASAANAVPVVGGIPAAPLFAAAGASITAAAAALQELAKAKTAFDTLKNRYVTPLVKVP